MGDQRERLLGTKAAAMAAKDQFESLYLSNRNDLAVGLGINKDGDDWIMQVFARSNAATQALPDHFGKFAVEVQITGTIEAQ